jgi:hypothetical protein
MVKRLGSPSPEKTKKENKILRGQAQERGPMRFAAPVISSLLAHLAAPGPKPFPFCLRQAALAQSG